ncbi:MAG: hypothetical protein HPY85_02840 [Anaerolineae bacterium]|nr:hypothetical protein [Anaerolineae bacterium]
MNHQQETQKSNVIKQTQFPVLLIWIMAGATGAMAAYYAILNWVPTLNASLMSQEQHIFWYLSRATAIVAYLLLWLNMTLGVGITSKLASAIPGGLVSSDVHQYLSILGLCFSVVHALILMGDRFLNYTLIQIFLPFGSTNYLPVWVGMGQIGFYLWVIVFISHFLKKRIGKRTWRLVHYFSYIVFLSILIHGIMAGSDSETLWMNSLYWSTGSIFATALFYRIITQRQQMVRIHDKKVDYQLPQSKESYEMKQHR